MIDVNKTCFLQLLSSSIRKQNVDVSFENIEWDQIYKISSRHNVHVLIYPIMKKLDYPQRGLPQLLMSRWETQVYISGLFQFRQEENINRVLKEFDKRDIKVILYRGLVLKDLYPYPELRIMGDIDIVVKINDLPQCEQILIKLGYNEIDRGSRLVEYSNQEGIRIELHNRILHIPEIREFKYMEDILWENTEIIDYNGMKEYAFKPTYNLAMLVLHVYKHYISEGVGLRQLCDIVLVIENEMTTINWDFFWEIIRKVEKETFVTYILHICSNILNLQIDSIKMQSSEINQLHLDILMTDIIDGGVFSFENSENNIENSILKSEKLGISDVASKYSKHNFPVETKHFCMPFLWVKRNVSYLIQNWKHMLKYIKVRFTLSFSKKRKAYLNAMGIKKNDL